MSPADPSPFRCPSLGRVAAAEPPRDGGSGIWKPKARCGPTAHRFFLTDSASFRFWRFGSPTHHFALWRPVPLLTSPPIPSRLPLGRRTTSAGNRQRPPRGGSHARRTRGSSSRHHPAPRRPARQGRLCRRRPGDLKRELVRLQEAVNTQHIHPRLGGQTPAQHRRGLRLQKLPASFVVPTGRLPLAAGRVTFIRRVSVAGTVTVLSQSFRVGKKHRGLYLQMVVDTGRGRLTAYLNGRVLKRWPYKLLNN